MKAKKIFLGSLGLLVAFLIVYFGFNYLFSQFYWDCRNISVGTTKEEVQKKMLSYISDRSYNFRIRAGGEWKGQSYAEELEFSKENDVCSIYLKDQKVVGTARIF